MCYILYTSDNWVMPVSCLSVCHTHYGHLTRYIELQVAHAPGLSGISSSPADFKGNRQSAIPACITARAWRTCRDACRDRLHAVAGKTFPAFPAHAHTQFYVSGKRPIRKIIRNVCAVHSGGMSLHTHMVLFHNYFSPSGEHPNSVY